jgi:outer membrane lipoprotein carrier protein
MKRFTPDLRMLLAAAISFVSPLVLTALSVPLLGDKVRRSQWIAVAVGFGGVLVLIRPGAAVQLSRPGKFRWTVEKPYRQLRVGDGQRVWVWDEDLKQVIVRKVGEALGATPAALLSGSQEIEGAFAWQDLPAADGLEWLGATPRSKEAAFSSIRLGFDLYHRGSGARTADHVVRFTNFERNRNSPRALPIHPPAAGRRHWRSVSSSPFPHHLAGAVRIVGDDAVDIPFDGGVCPPGRSPSM